MATVAARVANAQLFSRDIVVSKSELEGLTEPILADIRREICIQLGDIESDDAPRPRVPEGVLEKLFEDDSDAWQLATR